MNVRMASLDEMLVEQARMQEEVDRQKARGGIELDSDGRPEEPVHLQDVGIVNRRTARAAGLRNPKKPRPMAVPRKRRKR